MKDTYTLISGAGRGIGEEISKVFYNNGHYLYLLVHKKKDLIRIKKNFIALKCFLIHRETYIWVMLETTQLGT